MTATHAIRTPATTESFFEVKVKSDDETLVDYQFIHPRDLLLFLKEVERAAKAAGIYAAIYVLPHEHRMGGGCLRSCPRVKSFTRPFMEVNR